MSDWYPHVTVATVVEDNGRYLLVEEQAESGLVFNQPAGHLEADESLQRAALRETLEETGWQVALEGVVGIGLYTSPVNGVTYHRTTFYARPVKHFRARPLDDGIVRAVWMSYEEIVAESARMRSELVIDVIERYRDGHRYPLAMIYPPDTHA